ncbi:MAG TPA: pyridoxal-phosphate dependent enzyme [Gemmatimonadales bacterium]|jgi:cystathionine beta-synthase|nr:pyridoxal-phosphate dependent enzyme [Gemmatimonadales bacterium]
MPQNVHANILGTIGHTPLVRLNRIVRDVPATVYAKLETYNPGHSIKDRMAVKMIEDAERSGLLKPGGTIIEGTSGNTGMGLAIAAIVKGYKCIFTTTDKQSKEKIDALRAFGAEVVVCPTDVDPEDPRSYYSVSSRLVAETPNSWKANQYDNLSNTQAHYETTGPEIWEQTEGTVDHLLVGVGTGGTICGAGKFLKEQKPSLKVWGIDTYGSIFKKLKETGILDKHEIYPYVTEGIGEDFLPQNVDLSLIDHFEKVTDRDAAIWARELVRQEAIWAGYSAGSAIAGLRQLKGRFRTGEVVVVIFHDHGTRYLGKIFNPEWMRRMGYENLDGSTARALVKNKKVAAIVGVERTATVHQALQRMIENDFSQIPVTQAERIVGSLSESHAYERIVADPSVRHAPVDSIMQQAFPFVDIETPLALLAPMITPANPAVLVRDFPAGKTYVLTGYDVLQAVA